MKIKKWLESKHVPEVDYPNRGYATIEFWLEDEYEYEHCLELDSLKILCGKCADNRIDIVGVIVKKETFENTFEDICDVEDIYDEGKCSPNFVLGLIGEDGSRGERKVSFQCRMNDEDESLIFAVDGALPNVESVNPDWGHLLLVVYSDEGKSHLLESTDCETFYDYYDWDEMIPVGCFIKKEKLEKLIGDFDDEYQIHFRFLILNFAGEIIWNSEELFLQCEYSDSLILSGDRHYLDYWFENDESEDDEDHEDDNE